MLLKTSLLDLKNKLEEIKYKKASSSLQTSSIAAPSYGNIQQTSFKNFAYHQTHSFPEVRFVFHNIYKCIFHAYSISLSRL